jgi:hypothetical protein
MVAIVGRFVRGDLRDWTSWLPGSNTHPRTQFVGRYREMWRDTSVHFCRYLYHCDAMMKQGQKCLVIINELRDPLSQRPGYVPFDTIFDPMVSHVQVLERFGSMVETIQTVALSVLIGVGGCGGRWQ